jgi:hypothetical protein
MMCSVRINHKKVGRRKAKRVAAQKEQIDLETKIAVMSDTIRRFHHAEPTPPEKEIHLMTEEERKIYVRPTKN